MAPGHTLTPRPQFSTLSASSFAYGDDWAHWQRNLYPVTYQTDAYEVANALQRFETEVRITRKAMWRALKSGDTRGVQTLRWALDRYSRYARNCETQLRLILASTILRQAEQGLRVIQGGAQAEAA